MTMKLVVSIPAYNEEETIGLVIKEIPRSIEGIDSIEVLIIDDGSTDKTAEVAKSAGADKVVSLKNNQGLSLAFRKGLETALKLGADIIVNIDADRQYNGKEIPRLIKPILDGKADIVLGSRFKGWIEYMPFHKKVGNKIATWVTKFISGYPVSDSQTGFRAFTKEAVLRLNVLSNYTYVQETIIQAVNKNLTIVEVPVQFRKREGKSRLIENIFIYAKKAGITILRTYLNYKPLRVFLYLGGFVFLCGVATGSFVLIHYLQTGYVAPHYPTTVLTAVLIIIGFQIIVLGLLADLINTNRRLEEDILYRLKKNEYSKK